MKIPKLFFAVLFSIALFIQSPKISSADTLPGSTDQIPALEIIFDGTLTYIHVLINGCRYVIVCDGTSVISAYPEI